MIFVLVAACLLLAGCTDDTIVYPGDDGVSGDPVCPDSLPSAEILIPPFDASPVYPDRIPFVLQLENHRYAAGMRYLLVDVLADFPAEEDFIALLNEQPELFEEYWSEWKIPDGEYDEIFIGGDKALYHSHIYLFAAQVMDSCGHADSLFSADRNARLFRVFRRYPILYIASDMIGTCRAGRSFWDFDPEKAFTVQVPPGISFDLEWQAPLTFDWMPPVEYRYGWDIENIGNDDEWSCDWSPLERQTSSSGVDAGVRVLYIEARDAALALTRVKIEFVPVQLEMERDLLWVDDWSLGGYVPSMFSPSEEAHDEFWMDICSMVPGFDALTDIYPADEMYDGDPLPLDVLSQYKHVIWTNSNSSENAWKETIVCLPATMSGVNTGFRQNTLALYLAGGGSVLTCGRTDRTGGFYETFAVPPLLPASVLDEPLIDEYDPELARFSMAHGDYYITVIDKVRGYFKTGDEFPPDYRHDIDYDALSWAYESGDAADLDFPDTLALDDLVTCPVCFFNRQERGFWYVEVYDPEYYMDFIGATSHPCFTPIYRMKARSTRSPLHDQPIAIMGTIGGGPGSCEPYRPTSYNSYHFGFPLWFFEHEKVEQIAEEIFRSWEIR
jgi:hypothetical protein